MPKDDGLTSWREEIAIMLSGEKMIACTLTDKELDVCFDAGFGGSDGKPFTAWTDTRVLFPVVYDGSEWVGSVPRNPCGVTTTHQGGE